MLVAMKINGVCYRCLTNYKNEIVYQEEITEQQYRKMGGS